jgi:Na+-driven multidrug efflux pump
MTADIVMLFFVIARVRVRFALPSSVAEIKALLQPLFRIGLPGMVEPVSYQLAQIVIVTLVASLGEISLAARAYLLNFFYLTYIWNMAIASAAQAKIANHAGAKNITRAHSDMHFALTAGLIGTFVIAFSIAFFGRQLLGLYSQDSTIISLALTLLWINILVELGRSANLIVGGALKACGDSLFVAFNAVACMWLICVALGYGLAFSAGMGLLGIWIAAALDENIRGLVDFFRWRSGLWQRHHQVNTNLEIATPESI